MILYINLASPLSVWNFQEIVIKTGLYMHEIYLEKCIMEDKGMVEKYQL